MHARAYLQAHQQPLQMSAKVHLQLCGLRFRSQEYMSIGRARHVIVGYPIDQMVGTK